MTYDVKLYVWDGYVIEQYIDVKLYVWDGYVIEQYIFRF